jgi:hypothetical protein
MLFEEYVKLVNANFQETCENIFKVVGWIPKYAIDINHTHLLNSGAIKEWCENNCRDKWLPKWSICFFESEDDAMRFKLVWG